MIRGKSLSLPLLFMLGACASGGPAPEAVAPAPKPVPVKPIRIGDIVG